MEYLFCASVLFFGLALLYFTNNSFDRQLKHLQTTQGRKAAWEWYLTTPQWKKNREACLKAFGYRCAWCNGPFNLQAHHRRYDHLGHEKPVVDLIILCRDCHARAPRSGGLYKG